MKYLSLIGFIVLVLGGGTLIGTGNMPGPWYEGLAKPFFNPPNWLFGPAWTVLYILISIAGWLVWQRDRSSAPMMIWWVQLALNFAWSPVFFTAQQIGAALVVVAAMLVAILAFIFAAWPGDRAAAWLFVPYAMWVAFATLLNASIWVLN